MVKHYIDQISFCIPTLYWYRNIWNAVTSIYQAGTRGSYKVITGETEIRHDMYISIMRECYYTLQSIGTVMYILTWINFMLLFDETSLTHID